jgi:hypothetical protein
MFVVTDADATAIRAVYEQRGEFAAAVELRRLFPGITDNAQARECARTIAGWKPLPLRTVKADASYSHPAVRAAQRASSHTREADKLGGLRHARDDTRNAPSDGAGTNAR